MPRKKRSEKRPGHDFFAELSGSIQICPLCQGAHTQPYHQDRRRPYFQCEECHLVFVPESFRLSADQEKQEYDLHQNAFEDEGYRDFLSRAMTPVLQKVTPPASGLDFGCGPGPVLAAMLKEKGFEVSIYDPFYAPETQVLSKTYDFVTCTEVIEHVHEPYQTFPVLVDLLKPGAVLVIMTKRVIGEEAFGQWHYKNDQTHVCFYSEQTFQWLADHYHLDCEFETNDVVVLRKSVA